jgi:hypothetical protein
MENRRIAIGGDETKRKMSYGKEECIMMLEIANINPFC